MLSIFNAMFRTATKSNWDAPDHWKQDHPRKSGAQQQREADRFRRLAMRDIGRLF